MLGVRNPHPRPGARPSAPADGRPAPAKFAALRNADCRPYLFGAALAMMADNIEHVITYWVLWQKFHSPALAGFEVISHWVPFLLFSVYFGSLADRYDCRRLIQAAQALFMLVSALWGVLFLTNSLQVWEACLLLVLHGCAGALWGPGEQLMLHDFVGREELPSAVRLNATFRSLGILFGPVVGSVLLLGLGPTRGHLRQHRVLPAAHAVPVPDQVHRAPARPRAAAAAGRDARLAAGAARTCGPTTSWSA